MSYPRGSQWFKKVASTRNKRSIQDAEQRSVKVEGAVKIEASTGGDDRSEAASPQSAPSISQPRPLKRPKVSRKTEGDGQPSSSSTASRPATAPTPAVPTTTVDGVGCPLPILHPGVAERDLDSVVLPPAIKDLTKVHMGLEIAVSLADKLNLPATLEHAAPIVAKFSGRQLTVTMLLRILGLAGDWLQLRICQKQSQVKGIDSDVVAIYNCFVKRMTAKVREQWYSTKAIQHRGRAVVSRLIAHARPGLHGDPRMPASSGDAAVEENGAAGPSCPGDAAHPSAEGILRGVNTAACAYWRQLPGAVQKSLQSGEYGAPEADIVRPAAASAALGGPPERAGGEAELLREIRGEKKADILPYKVPILQSIAVAERALTSPSATLDGAGTTPHFMYVSPTKALAQDQLRAFRDFVPQKWQHLFQTYDGDVPHSERSHVRDAAAVMLTNPDMLHCNMLPQHRQWAAWFASLRYVVLDEAHMYKGVFGAHVAMVLRRLQRVCAFHKGLAKGACPVQFVMCTATLGDPLRHFHSLTSLTASLIDKDASPSGTKYVVLWNPPPESQYQPVPKKAGAEHCKTEGVAAVAREGADGHAREPGDPVAGAAAGLGGVSGGVSGSGGGAGVEAGPGSVGGAPVKTEAGGSKSALVPAAYRRADGQLAYDIQRTSPYREAARLTANLMVSGLRTIVFVKVRQVAELVLGYLHRLLRESGNPDLIPLAKVYRGGYQAAERRSVERELFSGQLLAAVATNALELGVDVGTLDAVVMVGYPGTKASLWQQMGRAGRGTRPGLAVLVALQQPLDQYLLRNPEMLFDRSEQTVVDQNNANLLGMHLQCAAAEHPVPDAEHDEGQMLWGPGYEAAVEDLLKGGDLKWQIKDAERQLVHSAGAELKASKGPHGQVSLRSISNLVYSVVREDTGEKLEEITGVVALLTVHDGAAYMYHGQTFEVTNLCLTTRIAHVTPASLNYYTSVQDLTEVYFTSCLGSGYLSRQERAEESAPRAPVERLQRSAHCACCGPEPSPHPGGLPDRRSAASPEAHPHPPGPCDAGPAQDLPAAAPPPESRHATPPRRQTPAVQADAVCPSPGPGTPPRAQGAKRALELPATPPRVPAMKAEPGSPLLLTPPRLQALKEEPGSPLPLTPPRLQALKAEVAAPRPPSAPPARPAAAPPLPSTPPHRPVDCGKAEDTPSPGFRRHRTHTNLGSAIGTAVTGTALHNACIHYGWLRVRKRVYGYHKCWTATGRIFETHPLPYPPQEYGTSGFWLDIPVTVQDAVVRQPGLNFFAGLHSVLHTVLQLLPLHVVVDPWDVFGISSDRHPQRRGAVLCVFDQVPGGIGICEQAFWRTPAILHHCYEVIANCGCENGCLSCIHSPKCDCYNDGLDKQAALCILRDLLFW